MQERGTKHAPASLWGRAVLFPGLCFPNFRLPRVGWGMSQHGEVLWGCWRSFLGVCGAFFPVCGGRLEASALPSSVCVGFQGSGCGAGFCWQSRVLKSAKLNSGSSGELEKCPEELGCLGFSFPARILCFRGVFFFFCSGERWQGLFECYQHKHQWGCELFSFLGSSNDLKEEEVGVGGMLPLRLCLWKLSRVEKLNE